ncbi:MAG: FAD-dependent oxidoreductase [Arhodomonas sp.]|nr:FAD-dependent oxidoreductase [Arhodomonas sp.]
MGGGIVGLATAMRVLERNPGGSLVLLEKEEDLGAHQTGHNSGVIHAGVYYAPGSLKAELCRRGAAATKRFCEQSGIPFEVCGKLIVATTALEVQRLNALHDRCQHNGIEVQRLSQAELLEREPDIAGLEALLVPSTGIVDYRRVARAMGERIQALGGDIQCSAPVTAIKERNDRVTYRYPADGIRCETPHRLRRPASRSTGDHGRS